MLDENFEPEVVEMTSEMENEIQIHFVAKDTDLMVEYAIICIDKYFGKDYHLSHPELIFGYTQTMALNWNVFKSQLLRVDVCESMKRQSESLTECLDNLIYMLDDFHGQYKRRNNFTDY